MIPISPGSCAPFLPSNSPLANCCVIGQPLGHLALPRLRAASSQRRLVFCQQYSARTRRLLDNLDDDSAATNGDADSSSFDSVPAVPRAGTSGVDNGNVPSDGNAPSDDLRDPGSGYLPADSGDGYAPGSQYSSFDGYGSSSSSQGAPGPSGRDGSWSQDEQSPSGNGSSDFSYSTGMNNADDADWGEPEAVGDWGGAWGRPPSSSSPYNQGSQYQGAEARYQDNEAPADGAGPAADEFAGRSGGQRSRGGSPYGGDEYSSSGGADVSDITILSSREAETVLPLAPSSTQAGYYQPQTLQASGAAAVLRKGQTAEVPNLSMLCVISHFGGIYGCCETMQLHLVMLPVAVCSWRRG